MRIGILSALLPGTGRINWNRSPVDAYIRFLESANAPFDYVEYKVTDGEYPASADDCDAYLITGSRRGVYDADEWIASLLCFVQDAYQAGKKLVGICFGHQVLPHALGGHAEKSKKGWGIGLKSFAITRHKAWMNGRPEFCSLYFSHQDQVMRLPPEAELLGGNAFCPMALFVIGDQALGIQGHPEFSTGIMKGILAEKEKTLEPNVHAAAVRSLASGTPDNQIVARWVANFFRDSG